jgi:hypothetical protein
MKLFIADSDAKCYGCNWRVSRLYALASSQEGAARLYKEDAAGLCGECIADLLVEGEYDIYPKASSENTAIGTEIENCVRKITELWGEPMNGDDVEETVEMFKKKLSQMMGEEE